jgi:hypothetical protein
MSEVKTSVYIVVHPKLQMMSGGKSQRVEVDTEITLTDEQAKRMGKKVKPFVKAKKVDASK